ncbi:MAG TPA: hypothetical protein DCS87_04665 [Rheinheimera sp.]|nr:hypothetical protein [Rheinheimera sp.]
MKIVCFLFIGLIASSQAIAAGALAIDSNQGQQYGFAYNYATIDEASQRALSECGAGCSVVETFDQGCAAYAADQAEGSTAYGWGTAADGGTAQNYALHYCQSNGGSQCIVRSWGCNGE